MRTLLFTLRFYASEFITGLICLIGGLYGADTYTPAPTNSPFAAPDYGTVFLVIAAFGAALTLYALKKGAGEKSY